MCDHLGLIKHNGICKYRIVLHMYTYVTYCNHGYRLRHTIDINPFLDEWILGNVEHVFPLCLIFKDVMARIDVLAEDSASFSWIVNIIVLMAPCVARASATMVLTSRNFRPWTPEGLISKQTNWYDEIKTEKECGGREMDDDDYKVQLKNREWEIIMKECKIKFCLDWQMEMT